MNRSLFSILSCLILSLAVTGAAVDFEEDIRPILSEYCYDCHSDGVEKGGVALDRDQTLEAKRANLKLWEAVLNNLQSHIMPPIEKPQPSLEQRKALIDWIESDVYNIDCNNPDPGRVTIRRLNRMEYNNVIRDLFGINFRPAEDFPADDSGYGFDNIGDVLSLSPLQIEKYLKAAEQVLERAIVSGPSEPEVIEIASDQMQGGNESGYTRWLSSNGDIVARHLVDREGTYVISVSAGGTQAGDEPIKMAVGVNGTVLATHSVKAGKDKPQIYKVEHQLDAGDQRIYMSFLNDYYKKSGPGKGDRNLMVEKLIIEGPIQKGDPVYPPSHKSIFIKQHTEQNKLEVAREIISEFAFKAFRRPVTRGEIDRMLLMFRLADRRGESFETCVRLALQTVLVSPSFLFREELQPEPNNPARVYPIDEYALASRLSFFIWGSMPDKQLFGLASRGKLRENLPAQVSRMLRDTRAKAMADGFAEQWLQIRNLDLVTPSKDQFPQFTEGLKEAMRTETRMFFRHIQRYDLSVLDFLGADYSFINEELAKHYNMPGIQGDEFRKVTLKGTPRKGVLTHGSVLTITSNPSRTAPVKRGLWVLENLLGTHPPQPPDDIPEFEETAEAASKGTLRERLEKHRDSAICRSCHARMDPLGFGLENFDAIGRYRLMEGSFPVDSSGKLVSGETFIDSRELTHILATEKKDEFVRAFAERMLTYALGRGVKHFDRCAINEIVAKTQAGIYKFSSVVLAIAESAPFQMRRGDSFRPDTSE